MGSGRIHWPLTTISTAGARGRLYSDPLSRLKAESRALGNHALAGNCDR